MIGRGVLAVLLGALALLANLVIAPLLIVADGRPDLVMLSIAAWALIAGAGFGAVYGFSLGLFADLVTGSGLIGVSALTGLALGYLCGVLREDRPTPEPVPFALIVGAATLVGTSADVLAELVLAGQPLQVMVWAPSAIATSLWNLAIGLPVAITARRWSRRGADRLIPARWPVSSSVPRL